MNSAESFIIKNITKIKLENEEEMAQEASNLPQVDAPMAEEAPAVDQKAALEAAQGQAPPYGAQAALPGQPAAQNGVT